MWRLFAGCPSKQMKEFLKPQFGLCHLRVMLKDARQSNGFGYILLTDSQ